MTKRKTARSAEIPAIEQAAPAPRPERVFRHAKDPADRPPPVPSNGGPRLYESQEAEMRDIGMTLYGIDPWIPRLAKDIGEHPRQVRRWANGEARISPIALHRCKMAVREHIARLNKLLVRLGEG